ncbi:hypothetical protein A3Q56_06163 [Intoshia linei]|uniref:Uncharacterized protein n=1 Tax=Intoshia linei TaxID=1819745 RepID=A0A177AVW7_9BILA|nr:hypothetical protein A3Q56_06163 [Intoshia linei]
MSYQNKIKYPKNENEVSSDVNFKIEDMSDDKYFVAKMPILDEMESGNYSPVNVDETMSLEFDDDTNILDREKLELEKKKDEYYRKLISQYNESSKDKLDKDSENMEIIDDFIRNFLIRGDFKKTFQCFQTEWFI